MSGDFSDFVSIAEDVGSIVATDGAEFLANTSVTEFGFPTDLVDTVGFEQAGSFAGNADWFDAFNSSEVLNAAGSVEDPFEVARLASEAAYNSPVSLDGLSGGLDFTNILSGQGINLDSITSSLPSFSDIKNFASGISSDFSGYVKQAQGALQAYQKVAPAVNAVSSALGIQNPINQIIRPISQGIGIASQATGATGLISKSSIVAAPGTQLVEMNAQQTRDFEARNLNPAYVNSFTDPGTAQPNNYDNAVQTVQALSPVIEQYQGQIDGAQLAINQENENIVSLQSQLDDPNLTAEQRTAIEAQIQNSYDNIATAQEVIDNTQPVLESTTAAYTSAADVIATTNLSTTNSPTAVQGQVVDQYAMVKNTDGTYSILDKATGDTVQSGLTQQQAILAQQDLNLATPGITINTNSAVNVAAAVTSITGVVPNTGDGAGTNAQSLTTQLRNQQSIRSLRGAGTNSKDWRVKLQLAPGADYLYKNIADPGILAPLTATDGVIFPYTPAIETAYKANYNPYDLTHSNFRGYFYQGSYVDAINVRGTFTAQDTTEANYLLAVIHFFRSVTKMFYGQDAQHGAPPPLVYLSGHGDYQFAEHPCVVSQFNYTLPPDVDYIRAGTGVDNNTNFLDNRVRTTIGSNPVSYAINRLLNNNLTQGALDVRPNANGTKPPVDIPTYVPTKMEIAISLLPMQSRQQVSTQFSLQAFANGNLLRGGFW